MGLVGFWTGADSARGERGHKDEQVGDPASTLRADPEAKAEEGAELGEQMGRAQRREADEQCVKAGCWKGPAGLGPWQRKGCCWLGHSAELHIKAQSVF